MVHLTHGETSLFSMKPAVANGWIGGLLIALGALVAAMAQDVPEELPSEPELLRVDLDRDGIAERIAWRQIGSDSETGVFHQVVVTGPSEKVLWKSPEILNAEDPLAFGEWHFGTALPQLAGDLDADGRVEMLAPTAQSDVSPATFRIFRWNGTAFELTRTASLSGPGRRGAAFHWTATPDERQFWVQEWLGMSTEGGWIVKLVALLDGSSVRSALGVLLPQDEAFVLARWFEPPSTTVDFSSPPDPAPEGGVLYRARLSARDHRNSSGAVLTKVLDIVRQDRANVHRGVHVDPEDEGDSIFQSVQSREDVSSFELRIAGGRAAENVIVRGTPLVQVRVSGKRIEVEVISP